MPKLAQLFPSGVAAQRSLRRRIAKCRHLTCSSSRASTSMQARACRRVVASAPAGLGHCALGGLAKMRRRSVLRLTEKASPAICPRFRSPGKIPINCGRPESEVSRLAPFAFGRAPIKLSVPCLCSSLFHRIPIACPAATQPAHRD
jgi:hypothetical protein